APLMVKRLPGPSTLNLYCGAPALKWSVPIVAGVAISILVWAEASKVAVPVGTAAGFQLPPLFQSLEGGLERHWPSWACAELPIEAAQSTAPAPASHLARPAPLDRGRTRAVSNKLTGR